MPSTNATIVCMKKKRHVTKKKPHTKKRIKKGGTRQEYLVPNVKPIAWSKKKTRMTTHLQDKNDDNIGIMVNSATASSSSICPSFPEVTTPKTTSHGP